MKTRTIDLCLIAFMVIMVILISSCHRPPTVARNDSIQKVVIREIIHDTTIIIQEDSSWVQYYIDCQDGKAKLTELLHYQAGQHAKPPRVIIRDRILTAACKVDSFAVYNSIRSRDTTTYIKTSTVVVPEPVNYLTGWQWFQVWAFRIMAGLFLIWLAIRFVYLYTGMKLPWQK